MNIYFKLIDFLIPIFAIYLIFRKGSLSIVYVPFFYFAIEALEISSHTFLYQLLFSGLLIFYAFLNLPFLKRNVFSIILTCYYAILLSDIKDLKSLRSQIIYFFWIFLIVPLVPEIFRNYPKERIFNEISKSAFMIMAFFIFNSMVCTVLKYYPENEYGFSSGVSFGHLQIHVYSVFPLTLFVILRKGIKDKNIWFIFLYFGSIFLVMLTLRRSVMALSLIGTLVVMFELLNIKQLKQFFVYSLVLGIVGLLVVNYTGFASQLTERIEKRNLKDRDVAKEGRFLEFELIYKDLFVYYEYNPWFGYGLFQSKGNYGKKIFGNRTLHTDYAYYIHAMGFLGLLLYLLMMFTEFLSIWKKTISKEEKFQFFFLLFYFLVYFNLGNSRFAIAPIMFILILSIPHSIKNNESIIRNKE